MKKTLLGTSAVALAGVSASSANAAEWDVNVGGFFNAFAVFTSEEDIPGQDRDGFDILTNGEIIFTPTITLDNGIQFGAVVEMEAEADGSSQSGVVDESFLFVEGSFGRVEMGAQDSAFGSMGVCSPTEGPAGVCSGTLTGTFLGNGDAGVGLYGSFDGTRGGFAGQLAGDAVRINYFTPRFAGFQVGASYSRGTSRDDRFFEDRDSDLHDILSIGANYEGNFGSASVKFAGTYETGSAPSGGNDPDQFHLGAEVGFGGFVIGGGYAHYDSGGAPETDFFDLGVGYSTGPWGVSLGGSYTDVEDSATFGGLDYDVTQVALNGNYDLGPGVNAVAFVGYAETDIEGGADFDGFVVGTGIRLGF